MDYTKLTDQERIDVLQYYGLINTHFLPDNWLQLISSIPLIPGSATAVELIDLYIGTKLFERGLNIPDDLNTNNITADYYQMVAPMLYLPPDFSIDHLQRAKRVIRIIRSLKSSIRPNITPTITPIVRPNITPTITPIVRPNITPTITPIVRPNITPTITPIVRPNITPIRPNIVPISPTIRPNIVPINPTIRPNIVPVNTSPINISTISTSPISTSPINTSPINTSPINTSAINTSAINTSAINTSPSMGLSRIEILPVIFSGVGRIGDFGWMINQPEYEDVLFLFNDNEEQFLAYINNINNLPVQACTIGGGNAVIRPYQCERQPRAAGIPTGKNGVGYKNLSEARIIIDKAFIHIAELLRTGRYRRVVYSAGSDGRTLGTSIFSPSPEIKEYIVQNIESLRSI